jgi:hypothetical protein
MAGRAPCGGCAARRAARSAASAKPKYEFIWTGADGSTVTYDEEIKAKAKVLRKGGSYVPKEV